VGDRPWTWVRRIAADLALVPASWRACRAGPDWPFWSRLGSLRAGAGGRQILVLVLPLLSWLIQLSNVAVYWAAISDGHAGSDVGQALRVNAGRLPLFCDTAMAQRIERAEAQLIAGASGAAHRRRADDAGFVIPVAGGVASFAEAGSPCNKVAGLGFGGVPGPAAWDEIERAYAALGAPVQVELAHLADPAIGALLTGRGYRLILSDTVPGLVLRGEPARITPPGVEVRPSGEEEFGAWLDVVLEGFAHPGTQGVPLHDELLREVIAGAGRDFAAAGGICCIALRGGAVAGGARLRMTEGAAQLAGATTAPEHRRRGVQAALLPARLADAAAAGCDIAVVTTLPGSKSQQNVQRQGFDLLDTRAALVRQP
jgi:GNAT superfamily N-acetyltransferase